MTFSSTKTSNFLLELVVTSEVLAMQLADVKLLLEGAKHVHQRGGQEAKFANHHSPDNASADLPQNA